ncbi:MAG: phosphoribosylanthranilate isomerase [Deltaproteobacteria bacterium HGW-Deltaproteobacteria-19]|jgi:phosphoribosylanthranilate isomerase|nr:MAG: phosphoribosylanthranilate isomerase [Deltaproteobacteria bacterium HGW-Deltaproteobacteria-19]
MTEIKICGITRLEDALCAARSGADALGFIFYPLSRRCVSPEQARRIRAELPGGIVTVGVFVNQDAAFVEDVAGSCGLDMIQLHGEESPEYCCRFSRERLIKAVWPGVSMDIDALGAYPVKAFLADGGDAKRRGGTGRTADWNRSAELGRAFPLVLAGGLRGDNIREALAAVRPRAVDINSGIETAPGIKDHERMRSIIAAIRQVGNPGDEGGSAIFRRPSARADCGGADIRKIRKDEP